jgi:hypothetical protein
MTEEFPTLKAQLEARIAEMEKGGTPYIGSDWWQYTEADQAVFEIEPERWPRMMMTWHCYEAFKRIADADWDDALIEKARRVGARFGASIRPQTAFEGRGAHRKAALTLAPLEVIS